MIRDEFLAEDVRTEKEKAFKRLFLRHYEALRSIAYRYVNFNTIAEDIVQEVYTKMWEERSQIREIKSIRHYLYHSVKNQALDYLKHEEVIQKCEKEVQFRFYGDHIYDEMYKTIEDRITKEGFIEAVQNAIEKLPEQTRDIYKMNRQEGLTYREIAAFLGISVKTVELHISKALRILQNRLVHYLSIFIIGVFFSVLG